jgi:hypothetical protein
MTVLSAKDIDEIEHYLQYGTYQGYFASYKYSDIFIEYPYVLVSDFDERPQWLVAFRKNMNLSDMRVLVVDPTRRQGHRLYDFNRRDARELWGLLAGKGMTILT